MDMNESGIVFKGMSAYRQTFRLEKIGLAKDSLEYLSDFNGVTIKKPMDGIDYLAVSKDRANKCIHYVNSIESLTMNTWYEPYPYEVFGDPDNWPAIYPSFREVNGSIRRTLTWYPPEYMKLYFVSTFWEDSEEEHYRMYNSLLCKMDGELWRPPLPNIYDDSKICMGYDMPDESSNSLVERHISAGEWFATTDWNHDLNSGQTALLLFNKEEKCFHPTMERYKEILQLISIPRLSWASDLK